MPEPVEVSTQRYDESSTRPVVKGQYPKPSSLVHTLKIIKLDELPEVYPPVGCLVAESEEIRDLWEEHLQNALFSDPRSANETRRKVVMMDFSRIKYTVTAGEEVQFQNSKTGEVICTAKQAIFGQKTVQNANGGVFDHMNQAKGTRADDPGIMTNVGYTAGLRNKPEFAWGKNLKGETTGKEKLSYKSSSWLAHGWNLALPYFPSEVVEDYKKVTAAVGGVGMDAGRWAKGKHTTVLRYIVPEQDADYLYETSNLPPPCANFGRNYVKDTHKDLNENKFGASITTSRTKDESYGGNFYVAQYGILIPGRQDQLVTWNTSMYHGTTLPLCDPLDKNPDFNQSGMSFTVPKGITSAYRNTVKRMDAAGTPETRDSDQEDYTTPIRLDDFEIKPKPRAMMEPIKRREVLDLPECPETKRYRGMKRPELAEEMKKRIKAGSKVSFSTSNKKKEEIIEALLRDDGILVDGGDLVSD